MGPEIAHLSSANYEGDYLIDSVAEDGTVVLKAIDTSAEAMSQRLGLSPVTDTEFERHFGDLPAGPA